MKQILFILSICLISFNTFPFSTEMMLIKLSDGEEITGRICLPSNKVKTIVFCIHGTGLHTYINKRNTFNFYDEIANGFCEKGVAFFSYNRRGVTVGIDPPLFVDVDSLKYSKYTPFQEVQDIECMLSTLRKDNRFFNCNIILYGISEGTIISSIVAERRKEKIDALLLHGYAHENMFDILAWQNAGHGVMIMINNIFDTNNDKSISQHEYDNEGKKQTSARLHLFQNATFQSLDIIKDNVIDIKDISQMRAPFHKLLMKNITENNGTWIKNNYMHITPNWFKSHFMLEPNKTRLLRVQ